MQANSFFIAQIKSQLVHIIPATVAAALPPSTYRN